MNNILQWLLTERSGWYMGLVSLLLAGLFFFAVVFSGVRLWQRIHSGVALSETGHAIHAMPEATALKSPIDWHLFGIPASGDTATLPQTHLQLELSGLMVEGESGSVSMAIISTSPGQPGQVFRVGDTLPSSEVRVYAITHDGVVLENGGHFERLNLQRPPLQFKPLRKKSILSGE